ncbi:tRNA modification GTPase MnmE [Talaromyces islandicus]|uniref:tRNA modification GTPase MnmE n=1 Tax=Talaromyces islandicus TaxID=28573 RepID=A0A0U1LZN0_TALIS|nr:tRNA modification GTPase MnmE [Talaromyces islandicus]
MRRFLFSIPARGVSLRHNGPLPNSCRVGQITTTAPKCVVSCYQHSVTERGIRAAFEKSFHTSTARYSNGYSTIYALSTAPGRAAIAVIRISGPACLQIYRSLCPRTRDPKPRVATLRALYDPSQETSPNTVLDAGALVLYFPSPRTVTGEDILELHVHGGPAIIKAVLAAIDKCNNNSSNNDPRKNNDHGSIRYAEPGEFTRRAFMNDRLDLPQIEALGDTLHADTEQQRRLAVRGANNALSQRYELWRSELLYARGELEALIDFSEDQHFDESPKELVDSVASQVRALRRQIRFHIENASKGEMLRNGIKVALLGAPNAGKSSLLNRVVGREAAIVSTEEGTTRDIVDVGIDLGGWYCKLGDMAGLRSSKSGDGGGVGSIGAVEQEGIRRAKARALESDVVVVVLSVDTSSPTMLAVEPELLEAVQACQKQGKRLIVAINKSDKLAAHSRDEAVGRLMEHVRTLFTGIPAHRIFAISCKESEDESELAVAGDPGQLQKFLRGLITTFKELTTAEGVGESKEANDISYWEDSLGVTHRQRSNLQTCLQHLEDFLYDTNTDTALFTETHADAVEMQTERQKAQPRTPSDDDDDEYAAHEKYTGNDTVVNMETEVDIVTAAEHLRFAAESLAKITGRGEGGDVEDVLGVVFEKFCVGK